jgi:hypothetical protein
MFLRGGPEGPQHGFAYDALSPQTIRWDDNNTVWSTDRRAPNKLVGSRQDADHHCDTHHPLGEHNGIRRGADERQRLALRACARALTSATITFDAMVVVFCGDRRRCRRRHRSLPLRAGTISRCPLPNGRWRTQSGAFRSLGSIKPRPWLACGASATCSRFPIAGPWARRKFVVAPGIVAVRSQRRTFGNRSISGGRRRWSGAILVLSANGRVVKNPPLRFSRRGC